MADRGDSKLDKLPNNVEHYSTTPSFTQDSVPKSLLNEHRTKPGVWGLLNIESGSLKYVITEPGQESEIILNRDNSAIIRPQQVHYVEPINDVVFHVAFHRAP